MSEIIQNKILETKENEINSDSLLRGNRRRKTVTTKKTNTSFGLLQTNALVNSISNVKSLLKKATSKYYISKTSIETDDDNNRSEHLLIDLLKSKKRKENIYRIIELLQEMPSIKKMLLSKQKVKNLEFLNAFAFGLKHEFIPKDRVVMKLGDKGDKFYIILNGSVTVFIPIEKEIYLTEDEYLKYLYLVRSYEEIGLLQRIISSNKHIYEYSEDDINYIFNSFANEGENQAKNNNNKKSVTKKLSKSNFLNKLINTRASLFDLHVHQYTSCSKYEYVDRVTPKTTSDCETRTHRKVKWFLYKEIVNLNTGEKFGDLALSKEIQKR